MPPSGECLHHIAPAAVMVDEFVETTQNTNKIQLLASNYGTFRLLVVCENFNPKTTIIMSRARLTNAVLKRSIVGILCLSPFVLIWSTHWQV